MHACPFISQWTIRNVILIGLLSAVGSLTLTVLDTILSLSWTPPFSLDITSVNPDISGYCVDVDAVNFTSSSRVHSECFSDNTTTFEYPKPPADGCYIYNFTVTAMNLVGNGTQDTVSHTNTSKLSNYMDLLRRSR